MKAAPNIANQDRPAPRRKTASGDFFRHPDKRTYALSPQALKTCWEQIATITATASGLPVWPSRDPIGENGGVNIYGFVGNNSIQYIDNFGMIFRSAAAAAGRSAFQNTPGRASVEFCGRICKKDEPNKPCEYRYTTTKGMSPQELANHNEIKRRNGLPPATASCVPGKSDKCSKFGEKWALHSYWHTHPNSSGFSPGDKDFTNYLNQGLYLIRRKRNIFNGNITYDTDRWDPSEDPYSGKRDEDKNVIDPDTSGSRCDCREDTTAE